MSHEDIQAHVKTYWMVFAGLLVLTVVTVAISRLDMGATMNIAVALLVAIVKGSLVACFFMHLLTEKQVVYITLAMTVLFFFVLLLGPMLSAYGDMPGQEASPFWSVAK